MSAFWQTLAIGDRVRVVEWPTELMRERMHCETSELYDWLIESGGVLTIVILLGANVCTHPWPKRARFAAVRLPTRCDAGWLVPS